MNRFRSLVSAAVLAAVIALVPQAALAVGPASSPAEVRYDGFENATAPGRTIEPDLTRIGVDTPAYWGRITQRKYAGSYGLWCAGSVTGSPGTSAWTSFGGRYPANTYGYATFDVPELADYYSATMEYRYTMPSLGSDDYYALDILWWPTADSSTKDYHVEQPLTAAGAWSLCSWNLSAPTNERNLSRTASTVRFQFYDSSGNSGESPTTGEGATIDELYIRGYKFGPVRSLTPSVVGGHVRLSWLQPLRSTAAISLEERPVAYRVWRSSDTLPRVWTELTTERIAATTFDDTDSNTGTFRYLVQAWDPGTGTGYGQENDPTDTVSIYVESTDPPEAPSAVSLSDGGAPGPRITVAWNDDSGNETGFEIQRAQNSSADGAFAPLTSRPAASTSYTDSTADWTSTWYYRVRAVNGFGTSAWATSAGLRLDAAPPSTTSDAVALYSGTATIQLTAVGNTAGSVVAHTYYRLDGGAQTEGSLVTTTAIGAHTLEFWSVDAAGGIETPHKFASFAIASAIQPTSITIRTAATTTTIGKTVPLSGAVTPMGMIGVNIVVYVMKPGKTYWTYSSNRTVYSLGGSPAWLYKYYFKPGMAKGSYKFKARAPAPGFASSEGFATSESPTTVTIRVR